MRISPNILLLETKAFVLYNKNDILPGNALLPAGARKEETMDNAVILAGGAGKRMHSSKPKVLLEVLGKPMLSWVTDACESSGIKNICVVKGHEAELIDSYLNGKYETAYQPERLGTGHAVMCAAEFLAAHSGGSTFVTCGDAPFIDSETIKAALKQHIESKSAVTVITAKLDDPYGYGRILRGGDENEILGIAEQKDCSEEQKKISEISSGSYWFDTDELLKVLPLLDRNNAQGEYYLTDTIRLMREDGKRACAYLSENNSAVLGANDRKGLLALNEIARAKVIQKHLENGVEFVCTDGVIISPDAEIGADTKILPGTIIMGRTKIGSGCTIGPDSRLTDTVVGDFSVLDNTVASSAQVGSNVSIGPFVQLRKGAVISDFAHVGDFVEIKNSVIGEGTAVAHLTYIGDSDVGKNVNFGCGVVTVNYDGTNKNRCVIKDDAFIGCNTNLIAPVTVGEAAYTAAGSTVSADVPDGALAIERGEQKNIAGYAEKKLARHLQKGKKYKHQGKK